MSKIRLYLTNILIGLDVFANTILGGAPSETISGRTMKAKLDGDLWGRVLYSLLDWIQPGHCEAAMANDKVGRHEQTV